MEENKEVLLCITFDAMQHDGNYNYPDPLHYVIVNNHDAEIIKFMIEKYGKNEMNFYMGIDIHGTLDEFQIEYITDIDEINSFKYMFKKGIKSYDLLYDLSVNIFDIYFRDILKIENDELRYEEKFNLNELELVNDELVMTKSAQEKLQQLMKNKENNS
ncbi:MAG: hypothetical protein Edafosvirus5_37 [Edafosvirus sp.]|uniref:Uncharacterized protein n=1 Tax=Edafosvirus sp. TaxID=2487765 RepID=A0A3G4ZXH3_9VIRU|nr:MAG: hypothetical protein Edafosvirus5_37 [Edafosvirus sp.]